MKKMTSLEKIQINLQNDFSYRKSHGLFSGVTYQFYLLGKTSYKKKSKIQRLWKDS